MRRLLATAILLALAVACALWVASGTGAPGALAAPELPELAGAAAAEVEAAARTAPLAAPDRTAVPELAAADFLEGTGAEDVKFVLGGAIVVVDEQGVERFAEDGWVKLDLLGGPSPGTRTVPVRFGQWSADFEQDARPRDVALREATLGGRRATRGPEAPELVPVPEDGSVDLHLFWEPAVMLSVRDQLTGAELDSVLLAAWDGGFGSPTLHPGLFAAGARSRGRSPIALGSAVTSGSPGRWFVGSPGYAWRKLEPGRNGDPSLYLQAGADLEVHVQGNQGKPGTRLRLYGSGEQLALDVPLDRRERIAVTGLVPGTYRLTGEIGRRLEASVSLGETTVELAAHRNTVAELTLGDPKEPAKVPLEGTLAIPAEWNLGEFELRLEPLTTSYELLGGRGEISIPRANMASFGEPATEFRWKAPDVRPGTYVAELAQLGFTAVLEVSPPGRFDARVEVPPPATVDVKVLDASTELAIEDGKVFWHWTAPDGRSGPQVEAQWNPERKCHSFRAPSGAALLFAAHGAYGPTHEQVRIEPGANTFELRLEPRCGLKLAVLDGTTPVFFDGPVVLLVPLEGQAEPLSLRLSRRTSALLPGAPGLYRLHFPRLPGYEAVPALDVRLEAGRVIEQTIQLAHKR